MPEPTKAAAEGMTLASEKQGLLDLMGKGESVHWQMGVRYNNIVDHKLAEAAGYKTARDFFAKEIREVSQATLSEYGAVAKSFPEAEAREHGCTKLALLLTYEAAIDAGPLAGTPDDVIIRFPGKDAVVVEKRFRECSVANLMAALQGVKAPAKALPDADQQAVKRMHQVIEEVLGGRGTVMLEARTRGRGTVVDLKGIPLAKLATVLDALKSAL
ncbi:MAG: hypothetical protein QM765_26475 [Myxococcales bacterium]